MNTQQYTKINYKIQKPIYVLPWNHIHIYEGEKKLYINYYNIIKYIYL